MKSLTIGQLSFVMENKIKYMVLCSITAYDFFNCDHFKIYY